jgi:hypothetical protein
MTITFASIGSPSGPPPRNDRSCLPAQAHRRTGAQACRSTTSRSALRIANKFLFYNKQGGQGACWGGRQGREPGRARSSPATSCCPRSRRAGDREGLHATEGALRSSLRSSSLRSSSRVSRPAQVRRHGSMKTGTQDRSRRSAVCALAASTLRARPCTRASSWC